METKPVRDQIAEMPWPDKLLARVITPGARPRLHGYDVEADLARNYRFSDLIFLSIVGEVPDDAVSRAFDIALQFLAPLAVNEAPTHAALLARICGGSTSAIVGTAAIGLGERTRVLVNDHGPFLDWLAAPLEKPPEIALARDEDDRASVSRLRAAIAESGLPVPALDQDLTRTAAILAVLHRCGLTTGERIEVAIATAQLASSIAEALAAGRGGSALREYPMTTPPFRYEESAR